MTFVYLNVSLGVAIIILNLLEIALIVKRRKKIKPYEQLLSSLAVADGLTGLLLVVSNLFSIIHTTTNAHKMASSILSCIILTTVVISIASLASIAIDRILAVKYPLYHRRWVTKSRVWFCAVVEWVATWILVTIPILVGKFSVILPDDMTQIYQKITAWLVIIFGVVFCFGYAELVRSLIARPRFYQMDKTKVASVNTNVMAGDKERSSKSTAIACSNETTQRVNANNKDENLAKLQDSEAEKILTETLTDCKDNLLVESVCPVEDNPCKQTIDVTHKKRSRSLSEIMNEKWQRNTKGREKQRSASDFQQTGSETTRPSLTCSGSSSTDGLELPKDDSKYNRSRASRRNRERQDRAKRKRERTLSRTVALTCVLIVFTYLVCTTPYAIQILTGGQPLAGWTGLMLFSNSLFNPLIYFFKGYLETLIRRKEKAQAKKPKVEGRETIRIVKFSNEQTAK
ncbi:uncharacterized protein LOC135691971 [Rhopilema esculentum]|uniref:uncharacterized protein LOC135691971 n=1 Tax=Rhopilema esculentum TaxID=499914 RepID=UPI0031DF20C5|eukprot:gene5272-421_t